jgi:hypothetical protein
MALENTPTKKSQLLVCGATTKRALRTGGTSPTTFQPQSLKMKLAIALRIS